MKLTELLSDSYNAEEWRNKGYELPQFDIKAVRKNTFENPTWVHFGGGNIFRAFPAAILNDALNTGKYDRGVIVAETFDYEVILWQSFAARKSSVIGNDREESHCQRDRSPQSRPSVCRLEAID